MAHTPQLVASYNASTNTLTVSTFTSSDDYIEILMQPFESSTPPASIGYEAIDGSSTVDFSIVLAPGTYNLSRRQGDGSNWSDIEDPEDKTTLTV